MSDSSGSISRRAFLRVGGVLAAGSSLPAIGVEPETGAPSPAKISRFRTLGRTGMPASAAATAPSA